MNSTTQSVPARLETVAGLDRRGRSLMGEMSWERASIVLFVLLTVVLKLVYVRVLRVDSDEPQHLHVVWGWTQGLVQYRDFFDNHAPLFQMLLSPLMGWLGERADIIVPMRMAMVPLYFGSLGCVYWLGSHLYSRKVGIWAALFSGLTPTFMVTSTEFRTDNLWVLAWFATVAVALTSPVPLTPRRSLFAGLLLGITFSVSMKTSLLLVSLLAAVILVFAFRIGNRIWAVTWARPGIFLSGLAGVLVVPLGLIGFFAAKHALPQLYYCVITHNTVLGMGTRSSFRHRISAEMVLLTLVGGSVIFRVGPNPSVASRRAVLFMTGTIFVALLNGFWPLVTSQDYLPVIPLFCVSLVPMLLEGSRRFLVWAEADGAMQLRKYGGWALALILPVLVASGEIAKTTNEQSLFRDRLSPFILTISNILRLAKPGDYVMDGKGETIFWRRPFYYVLEGVTLARMKQGLISDTIVEDVKKTGACVLVSNRIPHLARAWYKQHFIPISGRTFVAGAIVKEAAPGEKNPVTRSFEVGLPAVYKVISPEGPVSGVLDGVPYNTAPGAAQSGERGSVYLAAGTHRFIYSGRGPVAIMWAQAVDAGFSTFHQWQDYEATARRDEL